MVSILNNTEFLITRPAEDLAELFQRKPLYRAKRLETVKEPLWIGEYFSLVGGKWKARETFITFLQSHYTTEIVAKTTVQLAKDCICAKQLGISNETCFVQVEKSYFAESTLIGIEKIFVDTTNQAFRLE